MLYIDKYQGGNIIIKKDNKEIKIRILQVRNEHDEIFPNQVALGFDCCKSIPIIRKELKRTLRRPKNTKTKPAVTIK